jgi:hypothetical protein
MKLLQHSSVGGSALAKKTAVALGVGKLVGTLDPSEHRNGLAKGIGKPQTDKPFLVSFGGEVGIRLAAKLSCRIYHSGKTMGTSGNAIPLQRRQKVGKKCVLQLTKKAVAGASEGGEAFPIP